MTIESFNRLEKARAKEALATCCGSAVWVEGMMKGFPFLTREEIFLRGEELWLMRCEEKDWLEAFTHHPKIGDTKSLKEKFTTTKTWAANEQAGVQMADEETIVLLAKGNEAYEKKFGFIFIVCATGKSAKEMVALLQLRLPNDYDTELKVAMQEQNKITKLRLQKLFS